MYKKLLAIATFSGTIIGVGLFGLPYITAQVGFIPIVIYFIGMGALMTVMHLMYGEISSRTATNQRLPGYARIYLGKKAEILEYVSTIIGLTGALLAYIVIGSEFLHALFSPYIGGSTLMYALGFFAVGASLIYMGSRSISKAELISLGLFFTALVILFLKAIPEINTEFLSTSFISNQNFLLPYGVIMFSLAGASVIPEMRELLEEHESSLKKLIIIGSAIPIITYLVFIITIYGVTGPLTTQEGLIGFNSIMGSGIAQLGFVFGIITTFTSFLTLGITLKKEFNLDWGLPKFTSWVCAVMPALILYILGLQNFIAIIGFVGAVALGIDITVTTLIYLKAKKQGTRVPSYSLRLPKIVIISLTSIFVIGAVLEIISIFS